MVRGNVHKVTEVFLAKKYCARKALSEMLFILRDLDESSDSDEDDTSSVD